MRWSSADGCPSSELRADIAIFLTEIPYNSAIDSAYGRRTQRYGAVVSGERAGRLRASVAA